MLWNKNLDYSLISDDCLIDEYNKIYEEINKRKVFYSSQDQTLRWFWKEPIFLWRDEKWRLTKWKIILKFLLENKWRLVTLAEISDELENSWFSILTEKQDLPKAVNTIISNLWSQRSLFKPYKEVLNIKNIHGEGYIIE